MSSLGRAVGVLRVGSQILRRGTQKMVVRKAGGGPHIEAQYRQYPQLTKNQKFHAELISGAMWFWILWHCWHDPDAVFGHFPGLMPLVGQMRNWESHQMMKNEGLDHASCACPPDFLCAEGYWTMSTWIC